MTSIKWQGAVSALDTDPATPAAGVSLYVDGSRVRVGPADPASDDARSFLSSSTQTRLVGSLEHALSGALSRLSQRIEAVTWPASGSLVTGQDGVVSGARQVNVPADFSADLSASLNAPGVSSLEERLATRKRDGDASSGLAAGTYGFTLSLGEATDGLSVSIGSGWSTGQVLNAVADAVNASSLAVGATVRTSTSGFLNGLETLSLSADAAQAGQAVTLAASASASNGFANWLGLSAANVSPGAADTPVEPGSIDVAALSTAKPTRYASQGFDPNAPTTLAPGSYTLDYMLGPTTVGTTPGNAGEAGSVSFQVSSGDTWQDVLSRMARVLGSASPALVAQLVPAKRTWTLPDSAGGGTGQSDAVGLEVLADTDKSGWRLRLSGADAASDSLLAALGLDATAQPGSTARAVIGGQTRESATGTFSAAAGRMTVGVSGTFGEAAPVSVSEAATSLADALADVLISYNEVGGLLEKNQESLAPGVAENWSGLAASRASALGGIGVERASRALWLSEEKFLIALFARPQDVQGVLLATGGFLPALEDVTVSALKDKGVEDWISASSKDRENETGPEQYQRALEGRTEAQVEKSSQLLDLYDSASGGALDFLPGGGAGGLLQRKG
jgi:hypothetical protein